MVQLPRYVALKSKYNKEYLRYVNEASQVQTYLQYSGKEVLTPCTKFEFERAECDPTLVNIRCCYSNKYWVSKPSDHHFMVAAADQKQEDKSKWNCTLFEPMYDTDHQAFRFRHVFLGLNVVLWRVAAPYGDCLRAEWAVPDRDLCDLSTVVNWESLLSLPKYVAFKCDVGSYLSARMIDNLPYLQFASENIGDNTIGMETFTTKDGSTRIKSKHFGKFWKRKTSNWILADSTDTTTENSDTLFWPSRVDSNVVALRNLGNDSYVKRYTAECKTSCLNAATKTIDQYAKLQLTELVLSRAINNVNFRVPNARIYDEVAVVLASASATNKTNVPETIDLKLSWAEAFTSQWTSSVSMKLDVKTAIQTRVPSIADGGKVIMPDEFSGEYKWGETKKTSKKVEKTFTTTIPPMSTIILSLMATKGTCEVPFSYKQCDSLPDGKAVTYSMDDGVYYGTNYYNIKYDTKAKAVAI